MKKDQERALKVKMLSIVPRTRYPNSGASSSRENHQPRFGLMTPREMCLESKAPDSIKNVPLDPHVSFLLLTPSEILVGSGFPQPE